MGFVATCGYLRGNLRVPLATQRNSLRKFHLRLLAITCESVWPERLKAPDKRSQHTNATYRNIVGRNMLPAFGHRVAMCCDMCLKMVKFKPTTPNTSQHVATGIGQKTCSFCANCTSESSSHQVFNKQT